MDRNDLRHAMKKVEDLDERWQSRRVELENHLEEMWARLKEDTEKSGEEARTPEIYHEISRLDRTISLINRALMHVDDLERGERQAKDVPLEPGSSDEERKG